MRHAPLYRRLVVDIRKVRHYCLSNEHPRGRHKARVFRSRLGLSADDAQLLRHALIQAVDQPGASFVPMVSDAYGQRFVLDFEMTTASGSATLRSGWIILAGERVLRFVTCYVLK